MDATLVTDVLQDALSKYPAPVVFNSDQDSQYTGAQHIELLKNHHIMISMNGKGRSIGYKKPMNVYLEDLQKVA